jgi:septum formation protein
LGLHFEVAPSSYDEPARRPDEPPKRYAVRAARTKVQDVSASYRSGLVIGADTIVVVRDLILGKPSDESDALRMLRLLSGRWHDVITGIAVHDCDTGRRRSTYSLSKVHFRRLNAKEIGWYLGTGEHHDKAGAYAIQGRAALFIDRIEGCYFNIVGFPVAAFDRICRVMGIHPFL